MTELRECRTCPAFGPFCEGDDQADRCQEHEGWLDILPGLALDMPLAPQPQFQLSGYFPQLLNGLEVPAMLSREPLVAVGIAKALTPRGQVSRRATPVRYGPRSLRAQWGIGGDTRLVCIGNYLDPYLERLWQAQGQENIWGRLQALAFELATSLSFSIYLDRPRLEHLINIKRTWLTVQRMQETSTLIPIPHLQWATLLDLERQLDYAQEQGFHTLTLNLQLIKRQGWDTVAQGLALIREQSRTTPELRLLFTGVAGLRRMAELAEAFPTAAFTNTTAHYLAQRHVRLTRDGTRLIKEPVEGHPDLILAENVGLYRDFLAEVRGTLPQARPAQPQVTLCQPDLAVVLEKFGFDPGAALDAEDLLITDEAIRAAFQEWVSTGRLEQDFGGSFPTWPCAECVPHPTLGALLDEGADPLDAFLYLGTLAQRVDAEIEVQVGRAGY